MAYSRHRDTLHKTSSHLELIGHLNAKLSTSIALPSSISPSSRDEDITSTVCNLLAASGVQSKYNHQSQRAFLAQRDKSNGSANASHHQIPVSLNSAAMSGSRSTGSHIPAAHSSSNSQPNVTGRHPGEDKRDSFLKRRDLSASDASGSTQSQRTTAKRPRVRDLVADRHSASRQNPSSSIPPSFSSALTHLGLHQQQPLPLPLLKPKPSKEAAYKCDKAKDQPKGAAFGQSEDIEAPLNLCMKRPAAATATSSASDWSKRNNSSHWERRGNVFRSHEEDSGAAPGVPQPAHSGENASFPKKRGRKPKSLLASSSQGSNLPIIVVPATAENKPRRRGRPPILSSPPGMVTGGTGSVLSETPVKGSPAECIMPLISSSRLTVGALTPNTTSATNLLQPGWPTFSPTGQIIFPAKLNGSLMSESLKRRSAEVRDFISGASGEEESRATDSGSDLGGSHVHGEEDSASDSQDSGANRGEDGRSLNVPRVTLNENEIRVPLEYGWRRETWIKCFSRSGVRGEVYYYAPCGKRLKSYPEVLRYLTKHNIKDISRDNFSFSSKVNIGNFIEPADDGSARLTLTASEVIQRLDEAKRSRIRRMGGNDVKRRGRRPKEVSEARDGKRIKLHEEMRNDMMRERQMTMAANAEQASNEMKVLEMVESLRRNRAEQIEKMKEDEILKKIQERELKRQQAELQREQDMQRRRELQMMAEIERERRRQHMMLVRALEAHKRQEERERKKEEMMAEKRALQERKLQKKRLELELMKELKKPVDDMMLKDLEPLPTLNRIPGLKLPGKAFADILTVFEFLHNFGETLGFDMDSLPSLNTLQQALLNLDEGAEEELLSIIHHLLVCAIDDPGIPVNVTTVMGQKLKDAPITNYNISEILRLYFQSFVFQRDSKEEERVESRLFKILTSGKPFLSLNATQKAEIMTYLCNELLCNQAIVKQIDDNIETVANLRRDKWVIESDLRKFKTIKVKREKRSEEQQSGDDEIKKQDKPDGEVAIDEDSGESESEETNNGAVNEPDEEPEMTNEEVDKKIEKLSRQCTLVTNKLNKAIHGLRVNSLGQDRYRRRFWVLPAAGGVFVEGLESGEPEEATNNCWDDSSMDEEEGEEEEEEAEEEAEDEDTEEAEVKPKDEAVITEEVEDKTDEEVTEEVKCGKALRVPKVSRAKNGQVTITPSNGHDTDSNESLAKKVKVDKREGVKSEMKLNAAEREGEAEIKAAQDSKHGAEKTRVKVEKVSREDEGVQSEKEKEQEDEGEKGEGEKEKEKRKKKEEEGSKQSGNSADSPWLSPIVASVLAGSMMFGNQTNTSNNTNGFVPSFPFPFQGMENSCNKSSASQRPWFNILPRMPCCESTITEPVVKLSPEEQAIKAEAKEKEKSESASKKKGVVGTDVETTSTSVADSENENQQLGSLMNGLPPNLFMQAFLYPHILNSLFHQNRLAGGPCPPDASPFSVNPAFLGMKASSSQSSPSNEQTSRASVGKANDPQKSVECELLVPPEVMLSLEAEICPSLQRKLAQQKEQQHEFPQKIPGEYQRGWWRVTDPSQLKTLNEAVHERGVRERMLHKHLLKYVNYISAKCKSNVAELDITEQDRVISQECSFGAPESLSDEHWSDEVALRVDIIVLEQIEAMEEKIANSSMQIRGWRPVAKITNDPSVSFEASRCESSETSAQGASNGSQSETEDCPDSSQVSTQSSDCASGSRKGLNPIAVGRERLLAAEAVIERRYLKPPLGYKSNTIIISSSASDEYADNAADENAPSGLLRWRDAVREAATGSQLALLLHFLESCIAWDKSIMRASCQFCNSGENEAQLLLCDGCDKGYHTYCFKPKMETIPDGDWFCYECQNKNTIDKVCIVCGKKGKLLSCDTCPKVFHPNCIDPPVSKPPKGRWSCHVCNRKPKKITKTGRKLSNAPLPPPPAPPTVEEKPANNKETAPNTPVVSAANTPKESNKRTGSASKGSKQSKSEPVEKEGKKEKKSKENRDLISCESILTEMEKHDDSWPFLVPVNTKQFPTYKKIIKKPMDMHTIRTKLESNSYKSKMDFAVDLRLILDNCETFNEDESPVGQAGHNLRIFFEKKWKEAFERT